VIPRYVSTAPDGSDEREFLNDHFPDLRTLTTAIFRKGYEWPFDCERVTEHGSSLIDLLVHRETDECGRRVYLDYVRNPSDPAGRETFAVDRLAPEAREYLEKSGAVQATPIDRLRAMNPEAEAVFREHGIDLARERVRIAVCAQHNNGGLRANLWWESNLRHLFPVGEVCGTHGVRRPGGAALNAGQVGAVRAARYIAHRCGDEPPSVDAFGKAVSRAVNACLARCARIVDEPNPGEDGLSPAAVILELQERMSSCGAHVRDPDVVRGAVGDAWRLYERVERGLHVAERRRLPLAFRAADLCLTHAVYLETIRAYLEAGGRSRGSVLVLDGSGASAVGNFGDRWRFDCNRPGAWVDQHVLEVAFVAPGEVRTTWVPVRPIPAVEGWFERVWADFRAGTVYAADEEE